MTVQDTINFVNYTGNGVSTSFAFNFRADDDSWIQVNFIDNLDEILLNANQDDSPGGTVNYTVAPPNGQPIVIERHTPLTQLLNYTRYGPFDSESHEDALDKLTMAIQDLVHLASGLLDLSLEDIENLDISGFLKNIVEDLTPQLGGDLDANGNRILMADQVLSRPRLTDYAITHQVLGGAGVVNLDMTLGNSVAVTLTGNVSLTVSNPPATGHRGEVEFLIQQDDAEAFTLAWPSSFLWPDGEVPDLTELGSVHTVNAFTVDGGATWYASFGNVTAPDVVYRGWVSADGLLSKLPLGWTVSREDEGRYLITHNLDLTSATDLMIVANFIGDTATEEGRAHPNSNLGVNSFEIIVSSEDVGALQDRAFFFMAMRRH
jgi:hypothetical protein